MNAAHLHLLINHVPIFFVFFGTLALAWYWLKPEYRPLHTAGVLILAIGAVFTLAASKTGGPAADMVGDLPGVQDSYVDEHAQAAEWAERLTGAAAVAAVLSLAVLRKRPARGRTATLVVLLLALLANGALARTALLGGLIRHTEIRDLEESN